MLSTTVEQALNKQIQAELASSYLYLAMSAYCESMNLPGMASWLKIQYREENEHALKLYDYIHSRGGKVVLQAIEQPATEFGKPVELFNAVLAHEKKVTSMITGLYELAVKEADYPTQFMLQWFVNEQVEEEKNASDVIEQLKMVGDAPVSLMMVDRALGMRGKH
ncbi:MAG: ferritin [Acidobacteriota bacterium]